MKSILEELSPYGAGEDLPGRHVIFRNYVPNDPNLRQFIVPAPTIVAETELEIQRQVNSIIKEFQKLQDEPLNIIPTKANWDLKRDLQKKMQTLNSKTEKAIISLLKNRISEEKSKIHSSVSNTTSIQNTEEIPEEEENTLEGEHLVKAIDMHTKLVEKL